MQRAAQSMIGLAALAMASSAAHAQTLPPNIAGLWNFEAQLPDVCDFDGTARLTPTQDPAEFGCELTARQYCPEFDVTYVVEQTCTASIVEEGVIVQSTIVNFIEGEPSVNYRPDNFILTITDASTMTGKLFGSEEFPAEWRRANGAIS